MSIAVDVGAKWCDHCQERFKDHDLVDVVAGCFFHPECPRELPEAVKNERPRVQGKTGWDRSGNLGVRLGDDVEIAGRSWTPVLWDGELNPCWYQTEGLKPTPRPVLEILCQGEGGGVTIHVDNKKKLVTIEGFQGSRRRRILFPMFLVSDLCSIMLRESGVSTFRWSRRTKRHQVSMTRGRCASEVTIARF